MVRPTKKSLTIGAILGTTALTAFPAQAQVTQNPLYRHWDENGIDLTQGDFRLNFKEGSIGSGKAELELTRIKNDFSPSPWDQPILNQSGSGGNTVTTARKPDGSYFVFNGSTSAAADGSTILLTTDPATSNAAYQITDAQGVKYLFVDPIGTDLGTTNFCSGFNAPCQQPLKSITYPDGTVITLGIGTWHISGTSQYNWRLTGVSNNFGYSINFTYQSRGFGGSGNAPATWFTRSNASFTQNGVQQGLVSYTYPVGGTTDITDLAGKVWEVTSASIKKPGDSSPSFTVSGANGVTTVVKDGVTTTYNRVVNSNIVTLTRTDALNNASVITSDLNLAQITSTKDALNYTTSYGYDTSGRLTSITNPEGDKVTYTLDARGNATQITRAPKPGSSLASLVTTQVFPTTCTNVLTCNQPTSITDPNGKTTDYTYDPNSGQVLTITRPAAPNGIRPQTRYTYTLTSGVYLLTGISECQTAASCSGGADEVKTTIGYDAFADPTTVSKGSGNGALTATNTMTYDGMGNLLTVDGPLAGTSDTTRYRYDAARRLMGVTSPSPGNGQPDRAIRTTYDGAGRVTRKEAGTVTDQSDTAWTNFTSLQTVDIGFDSNHRPITSKLSAGGTAYALTQTGYDADGRPQCSAVRMNTAVYGSLPSDACTLGTQGSYGPDQVSKVVYDNAGEVTQVQQGVGTTDASNERTIVYNPNGTVANVVDANNNMTGYAYDGFDRLITTNYPSKNKGAHDSDGSNNEKLTYDGNSNILTFKNRAGQVISFSYDALNRKTHKGGPIADTDYGYDNLGRLLTAKYSSAGLGVTNTYDALSRLTASSNNVSGTARTFFYGYDLASRRTSVGFPVASGPPNLTVTYNYLTTGEVSSILNGATSLASYSYDALGNRSSVTYGNGVSQTYAYDPVSRLTSLTNNPAGTANDLTRTLAYNPASAITSATANNDAYSFTANYNVNRPYVSNGLNQYPSVNGTTFTYDTNGNLTGDGTWAYTYDAENKLTQAVGAGISANLAYDPLGRLSEVSGSNIGDVSFEFDGDEIAAEYSPSTGSLIRRHVFGPGVDEPIVEYDASGNPSWLVSDERGSVIAYTDSNGNAGTINSYDDYGIPGPHNQGRYQYTGQAWLSEIGLQYSKARIYSPTLGRFLQTDPIGYGDGMNIYAYTHNDPVNGMDPSGLSDLGAIIVTGTAISGGSPGISGDVANSMMGMMITPAASYRHPQAPASHPDPMRAIVVTGFRRPQAQVEVAGLGAAEAFELFLDEVLFPAPAGEKPGTLGILTACGCFEAGTLVDTPRGLVRIEKIKVGQAVLSFDEKSGKIAPKRITALIRPQPKQVYEIKVQDRSRKSETFNATADHPWLVAQKGWVNSAELVRGDHIESGSRVDARVASVSLTSRKEQTYNLEVADWHTFMVGNDRLIVHNNADCDRMRRAFERQLKRDGRRSLEKSLSSLKSRLAEHEEKIERYDAAGGYTSSVAREIRTFQQQIHVLEDILREK